ncbi:MAG: TnpV protein [Oscillospiraceae bacterium]
MASIGLNYIEIDGLLYPNIEIDNKELLDNLGKYGRLRLEYLNRHSRVLTPAVPV